MGPEAFSLLPRGGDGGGGGRGGASVAMQSRREEGEEKKGDERRESERGRRGRERERRERGERKERARALRLEMLRPAPQVRGRVCCVELEVVLRGDYFPVAEGRFLRAPPARCVEEPLPLRWHARNESGVGGRACACASLREPACLRFAVPRERRAPPATGRPGGARKRPPLLRRTTWFHRERGSARRLRAACVGGRRADGRSGWALTWLMWLVCVGRSVRSSEETRARAGLFADKPARAACVL